MDWIKDIWDADQSVHGLEPIIEGIKPSNVRSVMVEPNRANPDRTPYQFDPSHCGSSFGRAVALGNKFLECRKEWLVKGEQGDPSARDFLWVPANNDDVIQLVDEVIATRPYAVARRVLEDYGIIFDDDGWKRRVCEHWFSVQEILSAEEFQKIFRAILAALLAAIRIPRIHLMEVPPCFDPPQWPMPCGFEHVVAGDILSSSFGYHFWFRLHEDSKSDKGKVKIDGVNMCGEISATPEICNVRFDWYPFGEDFKACGASYMLKKGDQTGFFNGISIEGMMALGSAAFEIGRRPGYGNDMRGDAGRSTVSLECGRYAGSSAIRTFYPKCSAPA